jgi:hypothetical protein
VSTSSGALPTARAVRVAAVTLLALSSACGRGDGRSDEAAVAGVEVTEVRLGRSVGPDLRVASETTEFAARDPIHASVGTQGSANDVTLTARWKYQDGQVVDESRQTLSPTGPANTAFHIQNPSGWPPGRYTVEVLINGRLAETRQFTVR